MEDEIKGFEVRKPGQTAKGTITKITTMQAGDIFKKTAKDPKQEVYELTANVEGVETRIGTINKPPSKYISPKHKLAQFRQRYGQFPKVGMKVDVATDSKGFWKLAT
jgi:lysyl-tRNA synthetase class II